MRAITIGLLLAASLLAVAHGGPPSPLTSPATALAGLESPAEIVVDRWGVPHIRAASQHDAFFLQGWYSARTRLWEIDFWRRRGLGELAAAFGPAQVARDRAARLFTYRGDMDAEWRAYGDDARAIATAFVGGINAFVTETRRDPSLLPVEFRTLGYTPATWLPEDVVRVRDQGLPDNVRSEVKRAIVACAGGLAVDTLRQPLDPPVTPIVPDGLDPCAIPATVLDTYLLATEPPRFAAGENHADAETAPDADADRSLLGSNNWVVGPGRTATGRPILANDPHRQHQVPSLRTIVHLTAPGLDAIGAGEPALPGIVIGHNDRIAFGFTIFPGIDTEDLYVYETKADDPLSYRYRDGWEKMRVVHETIAVRGEPDRDAELRFTRHGPVILEDPEHHRAFAVRAAWLDPGSAPYFGGIAIMRARGYADFAARASAWGAPANNHVFADTAGNIGLIVAGHAPIRPNWDGLMPVPGDGRYEWAGSLPLDTLPMLLNPERGWIATANDQNLLPGQTDPLRVVGHEWSDSFRIDRIRAMLEAPGMSVAAAAALQMDYTSLPARALLGVLAAVHADDPRLADAIAWLRDWNGVLDQTSPQAALYEIWVAHHLRPSVIAAVAPSPAARAAMLPGDLAAIVDLLAHPDGRLGADPAAARDRVIRDSLAAALDEAASRLGPDRAAWRWGSLATAQFDHPLAPLFDPALRDRTRVGPAPKSGDGYTVSAAAFRDADFRLRSGASVRFVHDVGDWDRSIAINTPGQSGDPDSPHYRDLFPLWLDGKYFPLAYSRAAVDAVMETRLEFTPAGDAGR